MASGGVSQVTIPPRLAVLVDALEQPGVAAAVRLAQHDPDDFDVAGLERAEGWLDSLRAYVAAAEVKLARRRRELAAAGQAAPVDRSANGMRSSREQRVAADRETVCDRLPDVESALSGGTIAAGHVDAIAQATARLSDDHKARFDEHAASLVDQASAESVDEFARTCHRLARAVQADEGEAALNEQRRNNRISHRVDRHTGMHHIHAELDPETGTKVITAIRATVTSLKHAPPATGAPDREPAPGEPSGPADLAAQRDAAIAAALRVLDARRAEAACYDELMVRAFVELVCGARAVERRIPEISVLIDLDTLVEGLTPRSCSETSSGELLPPGTIRRLACEGNIIPIVLGAESEVLDMGRGRRLATPRNAKPCARCIRDV